MPERAEPKISVAEIVLVGLFLLILDAIDLIPIAGDLTDVAAAPLLLYYHVKHINGIVYGFACVLDLIPATQEIPTRTLVWIGTVGFDRFAPKKVEQAVESIGEKADLGEGGVDAEELGEEAGLSGEVAEGTQGAAAASIEEQENIEARGGGSGAEEEVRGGGGSRPSEEGGGGETTEEGEGDESSEEKTEEEKEEEDIMAPESEKNPEKVEEKKLFEEVEDNVPAAESDEDEEEEVAPGNVVSIDNSSQWQKNQQSRRSTPNTADVIPPKENHGPQDKAA